MIEKRDGRMPCRRRLVYATEHLCARQHCTTEQCTDAAKQRNVVIGSARSQDQQVRDLKQHRGARVDSS